MRCIAEVQICGVGLHEKSFRKEGLVRIVLFQQTRTLLQRLLQIPDCGSQNNNTNNNNKKNWLCHNIETANGERQFDRPETNLTFPHFQLRHSHGKRPQTFEQVCFYVNHS